MAHCVFSHNQCLNAWLPSNIRNWSHYPNFPAIDFFCLHYQATRISVWQTAFKSNLPLLFFFACLLLVLRCSLRRTVWNICMKAWWPKVFKNNYMSQTQLVSYNLAFNFTIWTCFPLELTVLVSIQHVLIIWTCGWEQIHANIQNNIHFGHHVLGVPS